jgi:hypothetical protein
MEEYLTCQREDHPPNKVYPIMQSYMVKDGLSMDNPIVTVNGRTEAYISRGMNLLVEKLNIQELFDSYLSNCSCLDKSRGNTQKNFGLSGQQNVGASLSENTLLSHYGATSPRVLSNSMDPAIVNAFKVGMEIGSIVGINFCRQQPQESNSIESNLLLVRQLLKSDVNIWAGLTLSYLILMEGAGVRPHVDKENCPLLSGVLNVSKVFSGRRFPSGYVSQRSFI